MWAGMEPGFEPGGVKHEPKKFQVTWFIKKKKKNMIGNMNQKS